MKIIQKSVVTFTFVLKPYIFSENDEEKGLTINGTYLLRKKIQDNRSRIEKSDDRA